MIPILCLGMSTHDGIYRVPAIPSSATKVLATGFAECGGGMAANAAVAIARLGGGAHYWGRVGDDALGERILAELVREDVDVAVTRRIPGCSSPSSAILVADDGERLVCAYTDPGFDGDPDWLPLDRVLSFAAALTDVRWPEGAAAVLDVVRRAGRVAVLDADVGPPDVLLDLASRATHAIFSAPGLALASGISAPGSGLARIAVNHPGVVGVTLGAEGVLWRQGGVERPVPAFAIRPQDTLAAGDVWHGAFTLALAEGTGIEDAARFGNAAAAIKCTRFGGRNGAPVRPEVEAFVREVGESSR